MEKIYVFELRCYHSIGRGCPIECYREEGLDGLGTYEEALAQAIKEFKRRHPYIKDVDSLVIEVLNYEFV